MADETYNGYPNYETWLVMLWWGETGELEHFNEVAADLVRGYETQDDLIDAQYELSAYMQSYMDDLLYEMFPAMERANVFADMVTGALSSVRYDVLAWYVMDDLSEDDLAASRRAYESGMSEVDYDKNE